MQNLLVLCQHCFTWVQPHSHSCPECGLDIYLDEPDLPRDALARILGTPLVLHGAVRVDRSALPSFGELIGTSQGILFLPRLHRRLNGAWEGVASTRVPAWWPFRGDHTSPRFLEWLRHPLGVKVAEESASPVVDRPQPTEISLVDRLIDSPGAFFAQHQFIQRITARKRTVQIHRLAYRSITLIDETEDGSLHTSLDALIRQAARAAAS